MVTAADRDKAIAALVAKNADQDKALAAEAKARADGDEAIAAELASLTSTVALLGLAIEAHDARLDALEAIPPPDPTPEPEPVPPVVGKSVTVTSVASLLSAAADLANGEVILRNGTYAIKGAGFQAANSLWIDDRFATRTADRPVVIRPETPLGVTFDGQGSAIGGISFNFGACYQTWGAFQWANGTVSSTGVVTVGGYGGAAPHHITMRGSKGLPSIRGLNAGALDHWIYGGSNGSTDFLFEDLDLDLTGGLATALHIYAHDTNGPQRWTFRRCTTKGGQQPVMIWEATARDILLDDVRISGARDHAVSYRHPGQRITLRKVISTGTGGPPLDAPDQTGLTVEPSCSLA